MVSHSSLIARITTDDSHAIRIQADMTTQTNKTKERKGATALSSSEEGVANGLAFKDVGGSYSEFLLIYEEPGVGGWRAADVRESARG